jgi:hypothetical protein
MFKFVGSLNDTVWLEINGSYHFKLNCKKSELMDICGDDLFKKVFIVFDKTKEGK